VIVRFVDIGGIDDHHCFKLSFRNHEIKSLSFKKIGLKKTTGQMDFFQITCPGDKQKIFLFPYHFVATPSFQ
jgi:hypothetical protein